MTTFGVSNSHMESWTTNRHKLLVENPPEDSYLKKAHKFSLAWLNGQEVFVLHTSGSTGQPKPISLKRRQMEASARLTGQAMQLPSGSRALVCLNVDYIAGIMMLVRGLVLDWELTIVEPAGNPLYNVAEESQFDFIAMVPLQLQACLQEASTRKRIDGFGKILLGGAPVSLTLENEIKKLGIPVYLSYGMTETVSHIALRRLNGTSPQENFQVLDGLRIGTDHRQCLHVMGAVTDFKLIQTNDVVEITGPDSFIWLGRNDSIINSGGLKIQLNKIDQKLGEVFLDMGSSANYYSWFEKDERLGQKLVLFVEGKGVEMDVHQLLERLRAKVKPFEIPKAVYFVTEFLKTPTDKIDKAATAARYYRTIV
jgi:o-succinylbenzoate---CoA ligase